MPYIWFANLLWLCAAVVIVANCDRTISQSSELDNADQTIALRDSTVLTAAPRDLPTRPINVAQRADGTWYIADISDKRVLAFTAQGFGSRAIGKPGAVPGRFAAIGDVGLLGDSVVAYDPAIGRLTIFDPAGSPARTIRISGGVTNVRVLDDSLLLLIRHPSAAERLLQIVDRDGFPRSEFYRPQVVREGEHLRSMSAVFADGRDGLVFATSFGYDVLQVFDYSGSLLAQSRTPLPLGTPTLSQIAKRNNGTLEAAQGGWAHHGVPTVMNVVALEAGAATLFIAEYDAINGSDLIRGGELQFVHVRGRRIKVHARAKIAAGLVGRTADGSPAVLAYTDTIARTLILARAEVLQHTRGDRD